MTVVYSTLFTVVLAASAAQENPNRPAPATGKSEAQKGPTSPATKEEGAPSTRLDRATLESTPECQEAQKKFRAGDFAEAKKQLELAAAKYPELPPAQVMLAVLYITSNQVQAGRQLLERAAIERAEHPEVYIHFGEIALAENRLCDAEVQFDRATLLAGNERWGLKPRQAFLSRAYAGLAAVAERRRDWDTAYAKLYLLAQLEKQNPRVEWRLGQALFFKNKPDDAYAKFQTAYAADKTLEPPELTLGGLWMQKKDEAKAEKWLSDAVKRFGSDVRTHTGLTRFYLDQGKVNEARTAVKAGLQVDANNPPLRLLDALVARAAGELDYAERALQELVAKFPSDFNSTNQLALVLADQEDARKKAQALDLANNNQKLNPNSVEAATTLGWALYRNGLPDRAEQLLRQAVMSGQGSSDAAYYLGLCTQDKKKDEAKKLFEAATSAPGIFIHRKECEEALKKLGGEKSEKKQ